MKKIFRILKIKDKEYFLDDMNNRWDSALFSEDEALEQQSTLNDCYGCLNCSDCTECIGCTNCQGCHNCVSCYNCISCFECVDCQNCFDYEKKQKIKLGVEDEQDKNRLY